MAAPTLTAFEPSTFADDCANAAPRRLDAHVTFAPTARDFTGGILTITALRRARQSDDRRAQTRATIQQQLAADES